MPRITGLDINHFRGHTKSQIRFARGLTLLVGENSSGKSTIAVALKRVRQALAADANGISAWLDESDFPGGTRGFLELRLHAELAPAEAREILGQALLRETDALSEDVQRQAPEKFAEFRAVDVICRADGSGNPQQTVFHFGLFQVRGEIAKGSSNKTWGGTQSKPEFLVAHIVAGATLQADRVVHVGPRLVTAVSRMVRENLRILEEFRQRSVSNTTADTESTDGVATAQALLTMMTSTDKSQRARYAAIREAFHSIFPHFEMEAVSVRPGSGLAGIQFIERATGTPLSDASVSAGVHQSITLLLQLVARHGAFLVVDTPESHLHPHSARFVARLIRDAAKSNQVVVVTHDPQFVMADGWLGIRRFSWNPGLGPVIHVPSEPSPKEAGQVATVLRAPDKRELLFARAVLVVEDESQRMFLAALAPRLGRDLDADAISVVDVGGQTGYGSTILLARSLGIPFVALKDLAWGDEERYPGPPKGPFFALGDELEAFLEKSGLTEEHAAAKQAVGKSKPRVAEYLGNNIPLEKVPPLFVALLDATIVKARRPEP